MLEAVRRDVLQGGRRILKEPLFAALVALCLGLGIGLNALTFSVTNALLLRPLPVRAPESLVRIYTSFDDGPRWSTVSHPDLRSYGEATKTLAAVVGERVARFSLKMTDGSAPVYGAMVSADYFDVLGPRMSHGRSFSARDAAVEETGAVAVLGHELWRRRYAEDPNVIGRTLRLNGQAFTVLGVAAGEFSGTNTGLEPELWIPLAAEQLLRPTSTFLESRATRMLFALGRLRAGATPAQAEAELKGIAAELARIYPASNEGTSVAVLAAAASGVHPLYRGAVKGFVAVLTMVVALVLLVSCANAAALFLTKAQGRRREMGIRLALGAPRRQLVQQLLTESLMLALLAAVFGGLLAYGLFKAMTILPLPFDLPVGIDLSPDYRVLLFALAIAVAAGLLFGLAPALQTTRLDLVAVIKDDNQAAGFRRSRLRGAIVVAQVAISLLLVIGSGLFLRALQQAQDVDLGFSPDDVAVASVDVEAQGYDGAAARSLFRELQQRVESLAGVESASLSLTLPLGVVFQQVGVRAEGTALDAADGETLVEYTVVAPRYFETLGIRLLDGRDFSDSDGETDPRVAIVNRAFGDRFWGEGDALDKRILIGGEDHRIVGVAANSKYTSLGEELKPFVYLPLAQRGEPAVAILARTSGEPSLLLTSVARAVQAVDAKLPVFDAKTLNEHLEIALLPARAGATALAVLGVLAIALASLGLYGTLAVETGQRLREISIRMALGAQRRDVLRLFLGRGVRMALFGVALGLIAAAGVTRFVGALLYGVSPLDPVTFGLASLLLLAVAVVASAFPAWRGSRLQVTQGLRQR